MHLEVLGLQWVYLETSRFVVFIDRKFGFMRERKSQASGPRGVSLPGE